MSDNSKPKRRGCLWALVGLVSLSIICGTVVILGGMALGHSLSLKHNPMDDYGVDEYPDLEEVWSYGGGEAKVVTVPIRGFIQLGEEGSWLGDSEGSSQLALMALRRATLDPEVRAVILDIDSGGGGITASDILYQAVRDFQDAQDGRVVVAIFGDVAASGAYYIALAADHIVARPTSITGSIGVLMQSLNMRELGAKIGVRDVTIKSGANKDILNPLQELTEEQRGMLQGIVDDLYTRFLNLVAERRSLPVETVRPLADGRVITANEAMRVGLVDEIGYWEDALKATSELLEVDDIRVFRYEERFSVANFLRAFQGVPLTSQFLNGLNRTRLLYQWQF